MTDRIIFTAIPSRPDVARVCADECRIKLTDLSTATLRTDQITVRSMYKIKRAKTPREIHGQNQFLIRFMLSWTMCFATMQGQVVEARHISSEEWFRNCTERQIRDSKMSSHARRVDVWNVPFVSS